MEAHQEIKNKDDVVAKASDFVIEYKDVSLFSQYYKLDPQILGEGKSKRCKNNIQDPTSPYSIYSVSRRLW